MDKEWARAVIAGLVSYFRRNSADYLKCTYNETQARTDFITPLLEAFWWDVYNRNGLPSSLREVFEEATVEVGDERLSKRPDYELRLAKQRKFFVEAKKPSVKIDKDKAAAFQARRYGYSASLPIVVLTNFHQLAIYDCVSKPSETDESHTARILLVGYEDFETNFDVLWGMLSREAVYSGEFDKRFQVGATRHGSQQFDDFFLKQVRSWRERLAIDINANTPWLSPVELAYATQLFLSRIVFLRICEDREIEKYETLKRIGSGAAFDALILALKKADDFYDSGLFHLIDEEPLGIRISDKTLRGIISELYYPASPYTFAVVETEMLGEIYEQFLGEEISVEDGAILVKEKPEVREAGGAVPTPRYLVDSILERTLVPLIQGKTPENLVGFSAMDPCCGSGVFLLAAYELLLGHYLDWYVNDDVRKHAGKTIYEIGKGQWRLTFAEKRRILLENIKWVDIDHNAVEVARLSLHLKLIEDETAWTLYDYVTSTHSTVLPPLDENIKVGNSLVGPEEWHAALGSFPSSLSDSIRPFSWEEEFPNDMANGGFDVIIENPPYVRIQNMTAYSPEEVAFYQNPLSPYVTARQDNFDKYALFIERSLSLLKTQGKLGVIVPNKFMTIQSGKALRQLISTGHHVSGIVHFGSKQVFGPNTSNYTCILMLDKNGKSRAVEFERVTDLETWRYGIHGDIRTLDSSELTENAWQFANSDTKAMFDRIRWDFAENLWTLSEIFVGVQTSADDVFFVKSIEETESHVKIEREWRSYLLEKGVLRPSLHDVKLNAYSRPDANSWIIFPYRIVLDENGKPVARLIQPDEFERCYPNCFSYLKSRREELGARKVTGGIAEERQWYQYGRSQSLTKFNSEKIILPILSKESRYAFDDLNTVVTGGGNGPYYLVRPKEGAGVSLYYLIAILNHPLAEAFVRTNTSTFRGGYYSHGKQFIETIPVPVPTSAQISNIESLVSDMIRVITELRDCRMPAQRVVKNREISRKRAEIESYINDIYRLSPSEKEIVRSVPIPD